MTPITHGIPKFFATITACEVSPPSFNIIPFTLLKSIDDVSAGVKSFAIKIVSSSNETSLSIFCILKTRCFPTETMSSDRCLKYSSSIDSNIFAVDVKTS